ncbi:hypothetical protein PENSPDRAFT_72093 [Peniophora sp. CONT]|nr:hypothetical protein PENSPDRAFT_72093 [Peniophora sp. CONT]
MTRRMYVPSYDLSTGRNTPITLTIDRSAGCSCSSLLVHSYFPLSHSHFFLSSTLTVVPLARARILTLLIPVCDDSPLLPPSIHFTFDELARLWLPVLMRIAYSATVVVFAIHALSYTHFRLDGWLEVDVSR